MDTENIVAELIGFLDDDEYSSPPPLNLTEGTQNVDEEMIEAWILKVRKTSMEF